MTNKKVKDNLVLRWNTALLRAVRDKKSPPPEVARAIAMVHTAVYDAWTHYHPVAKPVRTLGYRKTPVALHNDENRQKAISFAAFRVLSNLFPAQIPLFEGLMAEFNYDSKIQHYYDADVPASAANLSPEQVGNTCARDLIKYHDQDGSNQKSNYRDPAQDYRPSNDPQPAAVSKINSWQPLTDKKTGVSQQFLFPHWGWVTPFAFNPNRDLKQVKYPVQYPRPIPVSPDEDEEKLTTVEKENARLFEAHCMEILQLSSALNDEKKAIAEYWADGPGSETPPGHWCLLARYVSLRDTHDLGEDVRLFCALGNALFDASIACWRLKVEQDYCRPLTAIHTLLEGKEVLFWGGAYQKVVCKPAENWQTYIQTPPFAEFPSGHSTFSGASAAILQAFTGSDYFGMKVRVAAGSSIVEAGMTPAQDLTLSWSYFSDAATQAGMSRLYGGIHYMNGNTEGLKLGRTIGQLVWNKIQSYYNGTAADVPKLKEKS
ncbi:MAG: DUF6851 domain-containing protein [Saprospiraceae bacterium]